MPPVSCSDDPTVAWICDETLPLDFGGLCPSGCHLQTKRQMARYLEAIETAKRVPRLVRTLDISLSQTAALSGGLDVMGARVTQTQAENVRLRMRLDDAYTWVDVAKGVGAGVGAGTLFWLVVTLVL